MAKIKRPSIAVSDLVEAVRRKALHDAKINPPEAETPRDLEGKVNEIAWKQTIKNLKINADVGKDTEREMLKVQDAASKEIKRAEAEVKRFELAVATFPSNQELATKLSQAKRELNRQRQIWGRAGQAVHEWQVWRGQIFQALEELQNEKVAV